MSRRLLACLILAMILLPSLAATAVASELAAVRALPLPPATPIAVRPGPSDQQIVIELVTTDRYPRLTARFSFTPVEGEPPPYFETRELAIVEGGIIAEPDEVYPVDRVPTSRTGTYEAVWHSRAVVEPAQTVNSKLIISVRGRPEIDAPMVYVRPMPRLASPASEQQQPAIPLNAVPAPIRTPSTSTSPARWPQCSPAPGRSAWSPRSSGAPTCVALRSGSRSGSPARPQSEPRQQRGRPRRKIVTISPLVQILRPHRARSFVPSSQASKLRRKLVLAGRPSNQHYTRFIASKAGLGFGLFSGGFWLMIGLAPLTTTFTVALCLGTLGFMLPSIWLSRAIKKRQYEMRKSLPDALDLMTIGVSAGLAFDGALGEIIDKWDNELSREFSVMLGELRMGTGRREALLNLADRTEIEEIQTVVSQLIQAEELGMSLTDTLLTLANQMRLRRRQHAEELAQKAAVKMLIPLVFLIFPALFVVILGRPHRTCTASSSTDQTASERASPDRERHPRQRAGRPGSPRRLVLVAPEGPARAVVAGVGRRAGAGAGHVDPHDRDAVSD